MDYSNFITHGFLVDDPKEPGEYYRKRFFPAPLRQNLETFVEFETDSPCGLFLWKYDDLAGHLGEEAMKNIRHRSMCAILYETREEVDRGYADLTSKGVKFLSPPQEWKWDDSDPEYECNSYAAYFVDRFGYLWELWAYI